MESVPRGRAGCRARRGPAGGHGRAAAGAQPQQPLEQLVPVHTLRGAVHSISGPLRSQFESQRLTQCVVLLKCRDHLCLRGDNLHMRRSKLWRSYLWPTPAPCGSCPARGWSPSRGCCSPAPAVPSSRSEPSPASAHPSERQSHLQVHPSCPNVCL